MPLSTENMRTYIAEFRTRRRSEAVERLGGVCARCGSTERLEFDHIDPNTKVMKIANLWTASRARFEQELTKCQLLCRPCHVDKSRAEGSFSRRSTWVGVGGPAGSL